MRLIRSKDTKAELAVRRLLHGAGYRYRIHRRDLPGTPDLVFTARRKVIFVHGCFWHQHEAAECKAGKRPRSNTEYWHPKLARNVERDQRQLEALTGAGWKVMVIWECEVRGQEALRKRLIQFLGPARMIPPPTRRSRKGARARNHLIR